MDQHADSSARYGAETPTAEVLVEWVSRIASGDEQAFAAFYDVTCARTFGLAKRLCREVEAAEEIVSETYLQIWRQAGRYESGRGSVTSWLLTICRSRALDYLRRRDPAELHAAPEEFIGAADEAPPDPIEIFERHSRIHGAIARLSSTERHLLMLAFFRGLSHQEIADHTGMALGTVKTVLRKTMQSMKKHLGATMSPTGEST